jgi:hypothetical protein
VVVAEHIVKHEADAAVVRDGGIVAFAVDTGLAHRGIAGQEVGVESAVGLGCMETAHYAVVHTEVLHCFHKDVVASLVSDVQQQETADGELELGSDVGLVGVVRCVLRHMAGSGTGVRCRAGVEIVGTAEVVVLKVERGLAVETLMQQAAEVLSWVVVPERPASCEEK